VQELDGNDHNTLFWDICGLCRTRQLQRRVCFILAALSNALLFSMQISSAIFLQARINNYAESTSSCSVLHNRDALSLAGRAAAVPPRNPHRSCAIHAPAADRGGVSDIRWIMRTFGRWWRQAIAYAGGFEQRIRPGSWVVIKPNIFVFLRPQPGIAAATSPTSA
jgi:hypothetical protein